MADTIKVSKINELYIRLDCSPSVAYELMDEFSFFVPDYKFMPAFKKGLWDGKIRLFNPKDRSIYFGLLGHVMKFCQKNEYDIKIDKDSISLVKFGDEIDKFKSMLPSLTKHSLEGKYEFQWNAVETCIRMNKLLVQSPTSCMDEDTEIFVEMDDSTLSALSTIRSFEE